MGNKTNPNGFRLGIIRDWQSRWFTADKNKYKDLVSEDSKIRELVSKHCSDAGISRIEIERTTEDIIVSVFTSRPGIIIGRGGQKVDMVRNLLQKEQSNKNIRLNIQEIRQPDLEATLVAQSIAEQLERRIAFRRAMRQAATRTMQAGAKGIKIICKGRLSGAEIARQEKVMEGRVPLHTLRADIDYGLAESLTDFGLIGVKVWIYKGDILLDSQVMGNVTPVVEEEKDSEDEDFGVIQVTVNPEVDEKNEESS
jgi:small subunit ribosomal protein S3